jgi:hypothetical protein
MSNKVRHTIKFTLRTEDGDFGRQVETFAMLSESEVAKVRHTLNNRAKEGKIMNFELAPSDMYKTWGGSSDLIAYVYEVTGS